MSESEMGRALLACDVQAEPNTRQMVARVLERDRRRMRLVTGLALALWVALAIGVLLLVWFFFYFLEPKLVMHQQALGGSDVRAWVTISGWAAWYIAALAATALLAASCTVWLVLASRRATLAQVNAQLTEISEQLRRIREALAKPTPPPGEAE